MKNLAIYEILIEVGRQSTKEAKKKFLLEYNCLALRDVLKGAFDDSVIWLLPRGAPKLDTRLSSEGLPPSDLKRRTAELGYFVKGGPGNNLLPAKREQLFLNLLEGIHPEDAKVLVAMKDRKFDGLYDGLDAALVMETWPKLILKPVVPGSASEEGGKPTAEQASGVDLGDVSSPPESEPEVPAPKPAVKAVKNKK